jgi:hypothetical protein
MAAALGLDERELGRRAHMGRVKEDRPGSAATAPPSFVELVVPAPAERLRVEIESPVGGKLSIHFNGSVAELGSLVQMFLGRGRP